MTLRVRKVTVWCWVLFLFVLGIEYAFLLSFDSSVDKFRGQIQSLKETAK